MTFDRLPDESTPAYEAALTYFEMGAERSLESVAGKLKKSFTLMGRWSRTHGWKQRAAEWDKDQRARHRSAEDQALKQEAQKWAKRQLNLRDERYRIAQELKKKAEDMLKFPVAEKAVKGADGTTVIKPAKWSMADAVKMADTALKLEALAVGVATDRTEMSGPDGGPIPQSTETTIRVIDERGLELFVRESIKEKDAVTANGNGSNGNGSHNGR